MGPDFPTEVVASVTTGYLLADDFGAVHGCIEYLIGGPVFTHGLSRVQGPARAIVLRQRPDLAEADAIVAGTTRDNVDERRAALLAHFGPTVTLLTGGVLSGERDSRD